VKGLGVLLFLLVVSFSGYSQQDTVIASFEPLKIDVKKFNKPAHSPHKATIYAVVFPGLGQFYNKKYWKVPLVYTGFGALGYAVHFNQSRYTKYRTGYRDIKDDDPETNSHLDIANEFGIDIDVYGEDYFAEQLENFYKSYRRNRDLTYIGIALFYALQIVDASVDAHFFDYDISDDLSMTIEPFDINLDNQAPSVGVSVNVNF